MQSVKVSFFKQQVGILPRGAEARQVRGGAGRFCRPHLAVQGQGPRGVTACLRPTEERHNVLVG